jgi:hypothetical protein
MVWICSKCERGTHVDCENTWQCDCECNVNGGADLAQKTLAITGGAALAMGGLVLTIFTFGLGPICIGGAMLGAGVSSTWNGAEKAIRNERINVKSYAADVAFGAITGVATGGVGAVGGTVTTNVVKQGAKEVGKAGVQKFAVQAVIRAVAQRLARYGS